MRFSQLGEALLQLRGLRVAVELGEILAQLARVVVALLGLGHHDLAAQLTLLAMHRLKLLHDLHELLPRRAERKGVERDKDGEEQRADHRLAG